MAAGAPWPLLVHAAGPELAKAPTGIAGLDDLTGGGLPRGRTTLVVGAAGTGKSMLGVEFLVRGARDLGEPGILVTFDESASKISQNVTSLGFDLTQLQDAGKLIVQGFDVDPAEIIETGAFDLQGLFVYLDEAVGRIKAKRVVLDTIEALFGAFRDVVTIRNELGRLFRWLDERGLTAVVTCEAGINQLTRHGIEEYVSDCVLILDQRVAEEIATRRIRILKYRGSLHGTDEYPFLITGGGIVVQPLSAVRLDHAAPTERVSTGIARLDHMLGGGIFRGSSTLLSGSAGTGKTTLSAKLVSAACERGEHALYVSYEESPEQIMRNMRSVGIDLATWVDKGLLRFYSVRPAASGLEGHLVGLEYLLDEMGPTVTVLDGLTSFHHVASDRDVASVVTRMIDLLKSRGIAAFVTTLGLDNAETSDLAVSSLIDTWLLLRNVESDGERNRLLFVIKSRGTSHSNQVRELLFTDEGPDLVDVYLGTGGMLVGSARINRQAEDENAEFERTTVMVSRQRELSRQAGEYQGQIDGLAAALAETRSEIQRLSDAADYRDDAVRSDRDSMRRQRWADAKPAAGEEPR